MEKPSFGIIASTVRVLVDSYEEFVKEAAAGVSGDVVVNAYDNIKYARENVEKLWEAEKKYKVVPRSE